MNYRCLVFLLAPVLLAQAKKPYSAPHLADGQPDLQGVWTNPTITPFERPADLAGKAFLTEQEAAQAERRAAGTRVDAPPKPGDVGSYNQAWFDSGTKVVSTRQTSLVVDPPDGRVPLTPAAEAKRDYNLAHNADSYEFMSVWDRCITRGVPAGMFPAGYNNAYQIVQSPGYVVILYEMIHEARVIPLNSSAHLPENIRQWNGDSRGRWEGDTLVVDTTNYNGKGWIATSAATGRVKGIPQSEALHVVERFRRVSPNEIAYEVAISDPNEYSKPWKVAIPLTRDPSYQLLEYACQEGNHAVENVLRGGRALDQAKPQAASR
ncbi:MAG TPA: hypothetical protein VH639_25135 [Bryobacteraceae bacterium]|jgi:hypothetical protein